MIAVAAGLILLGFKQLREMPIDVFPEFAPPRREKCGLAGLPGLANLRSKSVPALSSVKLYFKRGTDLMDARQLVAARIAQVTPSLPISQFPPMMLPPLSATSRVMKIGISSKKHSVIDLSMITYWKIRQRLLRVPGVANIAIWGERLKMYHVQVDPKRLQANGVTLDQVMKTTAYAMDSGLLRYSDGA